MEETNNDIELLRIESSLAANRVLLSCLRLRNALKYNPYWHLQPRAPAGSAHGVGGQWISGAINAALPILRFVGLPAIKLLREAIRRTAPYLRRSPRIWIPGALGRQRPVGRSTRSSAFAVNENCAITSGLPVLAVNGTISWKRGLRIKASSRRSKFTALTTSSTCLSRCIGGLLQK